MGQAVRQLGMFEIITTTTLEALLPPLLLLLLTVHSACRHNVIWDKKCLLSVMITNAVFLY